MVHMNKDGIMYTWTHIARVCRNNESNNKINFTSEHFPTKLTCAWTILQSQGLTMGKLAFEPKCIRQHGLVYISLFHVKDIKSLYLLNKLGHSNISFNDKVAIELNIHRQNASYELE